MKNSGVFTYLINRMLNPKTHIFKSTEMKRKLGWLATCENVFKFKLTAN